MRNILMILFCCLINVADAQQPTISPSENNEYCPNTEYTFTVSLTKEYYSVNGENCYVSQSPPPGGKTITFKGIFYDNNSKQTFHIVYSDGSSYDFKFKKIKSLFYPLCAPIQPNVGVIVSPRCEITTTPVSFNNIQWATAFESPAFCFGSITTYEYLLPGGWSIGATISNGTDWIPGNNSAIIKSDLANGVDDWVYIRPVNSCGPGLVEGQAQTVKIPISRPAPALAIAGNQSAICSGCETFNISGMSAGATVQWSLSNNDASISGCSDCNTVTVCRNSSVNKTVVLTATVTHCSFTYPVEYTIALGTPEPDNPGFMLIDPIMGKLLAKTHPVPGATQYKWYKDGQLFTYPGGGTGSDILLFPIPKICDVTYNIGVEVVNACGTSSRAQSWVYVPCDEYFIVSPNPATTDVSVTVDENKLSKNTKASIQEIRIYDLNGNLKKIQKFNNLKRAIINTTGLRGGTYLIEITNGTYKESKQIIIKK